MKSLFLSVCLLIVSFALKAQCNINPSVLTSAGVYPAADSIPCITANQFYDITLQGKIDTAVDSTMLGLPMHIVIDSIRFDSIGGLPGGILMSQSPLILKGGQNGCIRFSGVTTDNPGQYPLTAYGTAWVRVQMSGTFPMDTPYTYVGDLNNYSPFGGYYLTVCDYDVLLPPNQTVCSNSTITLNPQVTGGTPPYTYQWSVAGNALSCTNCKNPVVTITQNSNYTLVVIDATNNSVTASQGFVVNGNTNTMQVSSTGTGVNCPALIDTSTFTITGGTPPYTCFFDDGSSSVLPSPVEHNYGMAGDYVVTVLDGNGCTSSILHNVAYNGIVVNTAQTTSPTCVYSTNGSLTLSATNGTPPYNYFWSNNNAGPLLSSAAPGNYSVTVLDAVSCSVVEHFNLSPANGWGYYTYLTPSVTSCSNTGSVNSTVYSGVAPYTYQWSNGSTNADPNNLAGGLYTVVVTDALGCTTQGSANVPVDCYSLISGAVFVDSNTNCVFDGADVPVGQIVVVAQNNGQTYYGYADNNGQYSIQVATAGTYTLQAVNSYFGQCANVGLCNNPAGTVTIATLGDTSANNNYAYTATSGFNLGLLPRWTAGNPGFIKTYKFNPFNLSPVPFTGQAVVTFTYDTNLIYQSSNKPVAHNPALHTLTWLLDSVNQQYVWFGVNEVAADFLVPVNVGLSTILSADFRIDPTTGDCDTSNNHINFTDPVTGSFDPNEKKVQPAGDILEQDSVLTYTIGFQNTGTDSTHFIILKDTLSPYLDVASVRNIAASHPFTEFSISGQGILTWTFNPLRLVDSFTNEPGSHGFVKFTVKKKPNLPVGSVISNKAYIYFDYNEPVITNTVANALTAPDAIFNLGASNGISVNAYPNPFSNSTQILVSGLDEKFAFELYDYTGRLKKHVIGLSAPGFVLQRNDLSSGIYFYRIVTPGGKTGSGKVVIE